MPTFVPTQTDDTVISIGTQTMTEVVDVGGDVADAGKVPALDATGKIDASMLPASGSGDMLKSTYDPNNDGIIAFAQLAGVASTVHTHAQSDIVNLTTDLANKANATHTHAVSDLTQSGATSNQVLTWNGSAWVPATASAGAITYATAVCTGDVTITTAGTWYLATGCTLNLTAGTWLIMAHICVGRTATLATTYTCRIYNTTDGVALAGTQDYQASANPHYMTTAMHAVVVIASGTKTIQLQATANQSTSSVIKATPTINGATLTNMATQIHAIKLS